MKHKITFLSFAIAALPFEVNAHDGKNHSCEFDNRSNLTQLERAINDDRDICIIKLMYGVELTSDYLDFKNGDRITCGSMKLLDPITHENADLDILDDNEKSCYETHLEQRQRSKDTNFSMHMMECRVYPSNKCS